MKRQLLISVLAMLCLSQTQANERAESVLEKIGVTRGICMLVGDAEKALRKLGWKPSVSFEEMIALMVDCDLKRLRASTGSMSSTAKP